MNINTKKRQFQFLFNGKNVVNFSHTYIRRSDNFSTSTLEKMSDCINYTIFQLLHNQFFEVIIFNLIK